MTTLNTSRSTGACVILEQLLEKHLLHLVCRHHYLEIILGSTFQECLVLAGAAEIGLFKHFQAQWKPLSKQKFEQAFTDDFTSCKLGNFCDNVISFWDFQLQHDHLEMNTRSCFT